MGLEKLEGLGSEETNVAVSFGISLGSDSAVAGSGLFEVTSITSIS